MNIGKYIEVFTEAGTDISIIQKLLGHSSPKTTQIYTHISTSLIAKVKSPLADL